MFYNHEHGLTCTEVGGLPVLDMPRAAWSIDCYALTTCKQPIFSRRVALCMPVYISVSYAHDQRSGRGGTWAGGLPPPHLASHHRQAWCSGEREPPEVMADKVGETLVDRGLRA